MSTKSGLGRSEGGGGELFRNKKPPKNLRARERTSYS